MQHKKVKDLIPEFAKLNGIDQERMELIVTEYYKYVREMMTDMNGTNIFLEGLGEIYFLKTKLEDAQDEALKKSRNKTLSEENRELAKQRVVNLDKMDQNLMKQAQRKLDIKEKKRQYNELKGEVTKDMEK